MTHVKAPWPAPEGVGDRVFITYTFVDPVPMACGTLGGFDGQIWDNWEVYSSNADDMPELQSIVPGEGETLQDAIIAAGWTLQYAREAGAQSVDFLFDEPAKYKHLALVWDVQWAASVQLELFGAGPKWPIAGDANGDCKVNILDLILIRNKLNQDVNTGDNWRADVNEDSKINILDLVFVRNALNTRCPEED